MAFLSRILEMLQGFLESIFASSSPEYKKKRQLRAMNQELRQMEPPIYQNTGILLPAFATALFQIYQFLEPVRTLFSETIASTDSRTAQHYREYLIELAMTAEQQKMRESFSFTVRAEALVAGTQTPEHTIEEQARKFSQFMKSLDVPALVQAGVLLQKLDCLHDFCSFDFNNFLALFDPAFKTHSGLETSVESPSFKAVEVVETVPLLLDFYYVLSALDLSSPVTDIVSILEAKHTGQQLGEEIRGKTGRIFQAVIWLVTRQLSRENLLAIIRITKEDPDYEPEQSKPANNYIASYKERLTERFHNDSKKLLKQKQENEMESLIHDTFGSLQLEAINGYNETTNTLLQEFTVLSLEWIKPLQLIKTFSRHYFDAHFKVLLKSVIVEGYFTNRSMQSALSSAYYYCESIPAKFAEFEQLFEDKEPCSLKVVTGYITELEKGMDFEKPLRKMVENMNNHARSLVQDSVNNFADVFNFATLLLEDNKRSVPETVTNIRTLSGSSKNIDSFRALEQEIGVFRNFLEIMKKYAIVGTLSGSASVTAETEI
ncbi:MAG: hypothetical protein BWY20_00476 [Spirochaetes bacterium ADurb.Bin215]|nr:MAG: hypothetical protein BWY20_00476 [Spirochaetes bacterium ADurb.Bin215]